MQRLDEQGYAPGMRLLELQRQRRSEAGDRDVAMAQHARGLSEANRMAQQIAQTGEQTRRIAPADLAKAESEVVMRQENVTKATRRAGLQQLYSPVDGTVQQLAVARSAGSLNRRAR